MKDFMVASAAYEYTAEDHAQNPGAGGLFIAENDVPGCPEHFCRW